MSIATELTRLDENATSLETAKTAIASAITTKGGTVASGDGFEDFPDDIASIPSGGGGIDTSVTDDQIKVVVNINPNISDCYIQYSQSIANDVEVDFGDGSPSETHSSVDNAWGSCPSLHHVFTKMGLTVITFTRHLGNVGITTGNLIAPRAHVYYTDKLNTAYSKSICGVYFGNGDGVGENPYEFLESGCSVFENFNGKTGITSNNVNRITFKSGITKIGQINANITSVKIPNSVREFGSNSFRTVESLQLFDMTEWTKDDIEACIFSSSMFIRFDSTLLTILFSSEEAMSAAKVATNFSRMADYMHYIGEEESE